MDGTVSRSPYVKPLLTGHHAVHLLLVGVYQALKTPTVGGYSQTEELGILQEAIITLKMMIQFSFPLQACRILIALGLDLTGLPEQPNPAHAKTLLQEIIDMIQISVEFKDLPLT